MDPAQLNLHHLRYFWAVAKDGNLTRTAATLRVAQSALSAQIRQLEAQLGEPLFTREGRRLVLTEAGRLTLGYAEDIFATTGELVATLTEGRGRAQVLSIGTVATLSRNFQESFISPLLDQPEVHLRLVSGGLEELLGRLGEHGLDLVLSNRRPPAHPVHRWRCRRIARQPVSLVGPKRTRPFRFPKDLEGVPLVLPGPDSDIRTEFEARCEQLGVKLRVLAEVDDMATLRLLARDTRAIALVPSVVVRDELKAGTLTEYGQVPELFETFYATTVERHFRHPHLAALLGREEAELLDMDTRARARGR